MNKRYRLIVTIWLTALLAAGNVTAGVNIHGSVFGGGNKATVSGSVEVNMTGGTVNGDVYGGGALADTNTGNGTNTTTVNLKGGTIEGDAYGGGLGDLAARGGTHTDVEAKVYGDITVNLGDANPATAATKFHIANYVDHDDTDDVDATTIVKSGRIFGCNNLNGSPQGNVTVNIYKTAAYNNTQKRTAADPDHPGRPLKTGVTPTYEVAAVYGGGNLANYTTTGKKTNVKVWTCDVSVESVYGGGNAAAVPETNVLVEGAYEIGYVFGGGNGKDPYTLNGTTWIVNGGANVGVYHNGTEDVTIGTGKANTLLTGGFIHEAYGASNQKGTIKGSATLRAEDAGDEDCALDVVKMVGAGKNADIDGDAILILGCMPETTIDQVFGGADNANVNGNVELTITSGNFRQVFGGNNESGMIKGHIILNIEETDCRAINIDELYLGGNLAAYSVYGYNEDKSCKTEGNQTYDDPVLNIISCTRIGQVFGGGLGAGAVMYASPKVNVNMLPGRYAASIDRDNDSNADGNAHALGTVVNVYGGGKQAAVHGKTTVNVGTADKVYFTSEPTYLGTKGTDYTEVTGDDNPHKGKFEVTAEGARITGNVYGGGLAANVDGDTEVNIGTVAYSTTDFEKVTIGGDVYGGGEGNTTNVTGTAQVNLGADGVGNSTVSGDIYGGSAFGTVNTSDVKLYHGTASQNVFGGGKGQLADATSTPAKEAYPATITTSTTVSLLGATVTEDIYGGCNVNGTAATTTVKLLGGSARDAFGGGLGENTSVTNDVTVEVGKYDAEAETNKISGSATVHDVYGGSAKGQVNNADENNTTTTKTTTTTVSLYAGTVTGDVYGGGLGTADVAAQGDNPAVLGIPAIVYGDVAVKLNEHSGTAVVGGSVFGCNNLKGTPKGAVTVDVYGTNNSTGSQYDRLESAETSTDPHYIKATDAEVSAHNYDLTGVFGGGNLATYAPTGSSMTTVTIHGCSSSSIKEVYGGGNAADVPGCAVNVYGAYEIGYVYAGGKGQKNGVNGATSDAVANVNGNATTTINGGTIYRTFAGANTNGDITGTSTLTIAEGANTEAGCQPKLGDVFSFGNLAEMNGTSVVQIGCLTNKVGALYGGAMNANVNNSITLDVNGGKFAKVFGGNKSGGTIGGAIKVNVEQTECDVEIDELYGCGNAAPYTTAYTSSGNPANYADPEVNIISCKSIGAVYGGGYGAAATVTGNPKVNINMLKATGGTYTSELGTIGNVYGGGNAAAVTGSPIVNIGTLTDLSDNNTKPVLGANITGKVFGGGCSADVDGSTTVNIGTVNYTVGGDIVGIIIGDEVYGAGEGHTTNVTGTASVNLGASGVGNTTLSHDIYGGSAFGSAANTDVHLYSGSVTNVFGGGKGQLASGDDAAYVAAISTKATVTLHAATITGEVYGGCNINGTTAEAELNLLGGTVGTSASVGDLVFGGGKGHSTTTTTATVNVGSQTTSTGENPTTTYSGTSSIYSNVYGGSALGAVGTAVVNLNHVTTLTGHVFGGGMGSETVEATITTSATVNQNGIALTADKDIYGGCNINGTAEATTVNLLGGSMRDVFGGGLGQHTGVTRDVVVNVGTYDATNGLAGNPTITRNVYGGSAQGGVNNADAENNTATKATKTTVHLYTGQVAGSVFGGGLGVKAATGVEPIEANVYGDVLVDLNDHNGTCIVSGDIFGCNNYNGSPKGTPEVHVYKTVHLDGSSAVTNDNPAPRTYELHAVYGGGNEAAFTGVTTKVVIETCDPSIETVYGGGNAADAANTSVLVKGAYEIGTVFGGGNGQVSAANVPGTATTVLNGGRIHDFYGGSNTSGTIGTYDSEHNTTSGGPIITIDDHHLNDDCSLRFDNIYGAGKNAHVDGNISMTMGCLSSEFTVQNLYGGAKAANVRGNVTLTVTSGQFTKVFGGNDASGTIGGNIEVNVEETGCQPLVITDVYGGGNLAPYTGNTTVNLKSFTSVGNVYGGGLGAAAVVTGSTTVNVDQVPGVKATLIDADGKNGADNNPNALGTIGNVYGGGSEASVVGSTSVNIGTQPTVTMVSIEDDAETPADERVKNVVGTNITGNVYGGGYGHLTNVSENVDVVIGATTNTYSPTIGGDIYGGSALGTVNGTSANASNHTNVTLNKGVVTGSVYGGGLGDATYAATVNGAVTVTVNGGKAANVFGCNNLNGSPQSTVAVIINGTEALSVVEPDIKNVYGGGNQAEYTYANAANPLLVDIKSGTIGNVYGGGLSADVAGSITVNIEGGKVFNDVYGGGALAHTNTANWAPGEGHTLGEWEYVLMTVKAEPTTEELNSGLYLKTDVSPVGGYYTKSGDIYTLITDPAPDANGVYVVPKAASDGVYYKKKVVGDWDDGMNNASTGTTYKTIVNLMGGIVGNVYGGGLGRESLAAIVYGDVAVNLGNGSDAATGFVQAFETPTGSDMAVPTSGRLFGCNNINGTPLGNVTVTVNNTQQLDGDGKPIAGHSDNKYDVHSVYGGGNLSRYEPANGKSTMVLIDGCNITSIEKVFGGGNSAAVPQTKVVILGTHRIGYAFGGGNGADKIKKGTTWYTNDGAPVYGDATVIAVGGKIGMTFAGSDTKGAVWGTATTKLKGKNGEGDNVGGYTSDCPLKITNSYGAGRGADILTDVNFIVSGCTGSDQIETVFGGSYDAHIRGNITLTITSGVFTQVFGGNDHGGAIGGDITVNIEESESTECNPTIIQYLYGGGREAAYPGTGAVDKNGDPVSRGNITVNVKSATRIDNVYGGGWRALINGDTEVNINMIKGSWAGSTYTLPEGYRGNTIPNSNMSVTYRAIPSANIEVGKTIVTGYYTYNEETEKYEQVTEQEEKAADVTYYEAVPTGVITIKNEIGTIGNVYGGSYQSETHGNATVNIGTTENVDILKREGEVNGGELVHAGAKFVNEAGNYVYDDDGTVLKDGNVPRVVTYVSKPVLGAHITGNVYGGGDLATMDKYETGTNTYAGGNTFVNICAVETSTNSGVFNAVSYGTVSIEGNVYGGGRGQADDFFCRLGMVGHEGDNVGQAPDTKDGTTVRIGNGTVNGSVYGGGEVARVEWGSDVTVGLTPASGVTSAPVIEGSVFGGGKGVSTHGYSALMRGDTHVTVQANAEVKECVYGGGEIASVGRYNVATAENAATYGVEAGMPYSLYDARTGQCHVIVQGNAVIGPDAAMTMPTFSGNVFGGGKGVLPYEGYAANEDPWRMPPTNERQYYTSSQKAAYLKYVETLALATRTYVTIDGSAFVKGSVYGGSEEGIVQQNTLVKIKGGQIGAGKNSKDANNKPIPHPAAVWEIDTPADNNPDYECASWPYESPYDTYDMYADKYDSKGGATTGKDGHTYYGNVFGGGCGKDPYRAGEWHTKAGAVGGNTEVRITGGHILTNVYGGNEMTNVGTDGVDTTGVCIITMSGGTLGVPRTLDQIKNHPVTCYLFGGGKGDQRVLFNKETNVRDVVVSVTGGTIYGSVFGGGEDGHVMRDVTMTIGNTDGTGPKIGTWGTSYVDGNVFGGGRGFAGDAYTAGNVAGSIDLAIKGGTMLGSIYGGGRLASVGYGLYDEGVTGYGEMRDDDKLDNGSNGTSFFKEVKANCHNLGRGRGHVNISISGGTIGNNYEFAYIAPETTINDSYRSTNHVPYTLFDTDNRLLRTKGGNVFAGGMGRRTKLNGAPISLTDDGIDWHKLGNVKSTKLTISGTPWIKGSVYGGGEFGAVTGSRAVLEGSTPVLDAEDNAISAGTEVVISGGTIGTMMEKDKAVNTVTYDYTGSGDNRYTFGSVYGGGYGTEDDVLDNPSTTTVNEANPLVTDVETFGAYVNSNTYIKMSGSSTKVRASVYGGGEMACVKGNTYVNIVNGDIGIGEVRVTTGDKLNYVLFGGYRMGNVYGAGKGSTNAVYSGLVMGNTNVAISGGHVYHNVYGGGAYGSVGTFTPSTGVPSAWTSGGKATVTVTGGTIGINGWDNGMVNGSGRGDVSAAAGSDPYDKLAWVNNTVVTIGTSSAGPAIKGSVYGGGENGHNFADATVNVLGGTIGVASDDATWGSLDIKTRGNVFGAGCGTDTYTESGKQRHNAMAGIVRGNTTVHVSGGQVYNSVYGGGSMGSVGTITNFDNLDNSSYTYKHSTESTDGKGTLYDFGLSWPYEFTYAANTGLATVTVDGTAVVTGWVFGSAKGTVDDGINDITQQRYAEAKLANVRATQVTIGTAGGSTATPTINQSVYGGGEDGHVYEDASVTIHHGTIAHSVFGGGKGEGQFKTTLWEATGTDANPTHNELPNMDAYSWTAGRVYGNATVTMNGGSVGWFIYGGGNMGSVGKGNYSGGSDDYSTGGYGELPPQTGDNAKLLWSNTDFTGSGITTVNILGGKVGPEGEVSSADFDEDGIPHGSVFGGSRGKAAASCKRSPRYKYVPDFFLGYVNKAIVNIGGTITNDVITEASGTGPEIYGSVYGGGQDGHVRNSTEVKIFKGKIKGLTTDELSRSGNVFGAGSGIGTYNDGGVNKVNNSSGSVTCTSLVEVYGDDNTVGESNKTYIKGNVYGGGALASVGPPNTGQGFDEFNNTATEYPRSENKTHGSLSYSRVNIKGGSIGGSVFGASRGPGDSYLATNPKFDTSDRNYDASKYATDIWSYAYVSGGRIAGSVYGGGEGGIVKQNTEVHLTGGTITNDAYGGGKGTANIAANVGGNTLVELNNNAGATAVDASKRGCVVERVFGCNDFKGTPKGRATVHVYATQHKGKATMKKDNKYTPPSYDPDRIKTDNTEEAYKVYLQRVINAAYTDGDPEKALLPGVDADVITAAKIVQTSVSSTEENSLTDGQKASIMTAANNVNKAIGYLYDVQAVYGGGNLAMYEPADPTPNDYNETDEYAEVIIDGCDYTSIRQVYGGGNAASTPGTYVTVNEAFVIDEVFGGGNGADNYQHPIDGKWYANPGANVGYYSTSKHEVDGTVVSPGTEDKPYYKAVEYDDADTKEERQTAANGYMYGSGITTTQIHGGTVHRVYGGSNKKGNIREEARSMAEASGDCELHVGETYGAGKSAPIDGKVNQDVKCASGIEEIYGGSKNSDVNSDIHLVITNGSSLKRVFGGNNTSGKVNGSITVEIKEDGCEPIHIQELYAGGYLAPYSVYGYEANGSPKTSGDRLYNDPVINVISASRIDNIFGGGYQATVVGNPHVNVNMEKGKVDANFVTAVNDGGTFVSKHYDANGILLYEGLDDNGTLEVGTIGNIYGGGNQADIIGDTYVEIGTGEWLNLSRQREMLGTYSDETTTITTPTTFTYNTTSEKWEYVKTTGTDESATTETIAIDGTPTPTRNLAKITGNVFGGGKGLADDFFCAKAMVGINNDGIEHPDGGTHVTIYNGIVEGNVYGGGEIARVEKNTEVTIGYGEGVASGTPVSAPIIEGNVFGAGSGVETHGYSALVRGNPSVTIMGNAKIEGSVYGGGEIASVARYQIVNGTPVALANTTSGNCKVIVGGYAEIGPADGMQMKKEDGSGNPLPPDDKGHVFGAGKGVLPEVYSYSGNANRPKRMLAAGTDLSSSDSSSETYDANNIWEYFGTDKDYHDFIMTLALSSKTDVTIKDHAFIKGSVYGGSENGIVQYDTHVTIEGDCQIGNGDGVNRRYTADEWTQAKAAHTKDEIAAIAAVMHECASWDYDETSGAPYDPYAKYKKEADGKFYYDSGYTKYAEGGSIIGKDGHTYYGNVFGGGSGVIPYAPGLWHRGAGLVRGNTVVDITGGHILTSVYGGNEHTDVGTYTADANNNGDPIIPQSGGKCTINMVGGTVGVPRTLSQIAAHPVTGYLFGSGKGDQRIFFNTWTNVTNTEVNVTGTARIFGSVLGGGEDGHVIYDTKTNIGGSVSIDLNGDGDKTDEGETFTAQTSLKIGTTGTSYVDGNVFGAGRGFSGDALTAGSVGGNVEVNIAGGTILGSVYGGGRLASVGVPFTSVNSTQYGLFNEDVPAENKTYGHVTVNITGGTIGNDYEDIYLDGADKITADKWTEEQWNTWKANNCVPNTEFELSENVYRATHTKGGNVFGGSMGRLTLINGSIAPKWPQLGQVKTTTVNISGDNTLIKSCVYGGGELGSVRDNTTVVIGKESKTSETITRPTIVRDLYGGGYGSNDDTTVGYIESTDAQNNAIVFRFTPMQWAGCVGKSSEIDIYDGWVKRNVYGGGEMASVGIISYEIEKATGTTTPADVTDTQYKTGETWKYKYITKHHDEANGFALSWPYEFKYVDGYPGDTHINVYGGRLGVDDDYNIWKDNGDVYGGSKGIAGDRYKMAFCGNVGSSYINIDYPSTNTAAFTNYLTKRETSEGSGEYVYDHDCIVGAVYGGGEDGHVMGDTHVTLTNGLIGHAMYGGGSGKGKYNARRLIIGATPNNPDETDKTKWTYDANQYVDADIYSITSGKVYGNTHVKMEGGYVGRFVYGGGNMGSVGKGNYAGATDDYSYYGTYNGYGEHLHDDADNTKDEPLWTHSTGFNPDAPISSTNKPVTMADHFLSSGKTEVEILGGTIGYIKDDPSKSIKDGLPYGSVFGGSRGESAPNIGESPRYLYSPEFFSGYVNETKVTIGDATKLNDNSYAGPTILGSVFGGGQDGHVRRDTHVIVNAGEIGLAYDKESDAKTNVTKLKTEDTDNAQWLHRGNVYGAGSGIGKYKFDFSNDGTIDESGTEIDYTNPQTGRPSKVKEVDFSTSAGSVTRFTKVEVRGGLIHRNVYGGGSMSSVGPPKIPPTRPDGDGYIKGDTEEGHGPGKQTLNEVIVGGVAGVKAVIGTPEGFVSGLKYNPNYGGYVFGASRGDLSLGESYGTSVWTKVLILKGATIRGNVFGGGDNGLVKQDTDVQIGEKKE